MTSLGTERSLHDIVELRGDRIRMLYDPSELEIATDAKVQQEPAPAVNWVPGAEVRRLG